MNVRDERGSWTQEACDLDKGFANAINEIILQAFDKGFSSEAIYYIGCGAIDEKILRTVIERKVKK